MKPARIVIRLGGVALLLLNGIGTSEAQQPSPPPLSAPSQSDEAPPERSLLFGPDEVTAVRKAIAALTGASAPEGGQVNSDVAEAAKLVAPNIFLSAVVDLGNGQWTVWANGYRINPGHQPPGFRVISVKENTVEIIAEGEQIARFRLHPYQTWRAAQHDIVEGIVP